MGKGIMYSRERARSGRFGCVDSGMWRACLTVGYVALFLAMNGCAAAHAGVGKGQSVVTKGPVLLRVYSDSAALMWESQAGGPDTVYYGAEGKLERQVVSRQEKVRYGGVMGAGAKTVFIHKVWLEALEPGEAYSYRVGDVGPRGQVYEFRTIRREPERVRFIVYGDSRSRPEMHRRLVKLMIEKEVDFVVHTGDLVASGDKYEQWGPQFFEPIKGLAERVPFYIAKGNHEGDGGTYEKLLSPPGEDKSFSLDYGPVHYFGIDNVSRGGDTSKRLRRITKDAEASRALWKFASFHVPSVNFGGHWSTWGSPEAVPAFGRAGIDFVVTGHSHQYERFRPVAPLRKGKGGYVTYVTSGGGGAPSHDVARSSYHAYAASINHFCLFEIDGEKLTMDAIDAGGNVFDHLEITKKNGVLNEQYLKTAVSMPGIMLEQEKNMNRED